MMPPGPQPEELAIQDMREPSQRMPIEYPDTGESPAHTLPRQSLLHLPIPGDIEVVIVVGKVIARGGKKGRQQQAKEQNARPADLPLMPAFNNAHCNRSGNSCSKFALAGRINGEALLTAALIC